MSDFFLRLNAPRATFAQDMNDAERQLMGQHVLYWRDAMARGHVLAFGLVADPKGAFGVGIVRFESAEAVRRYADNDPTIQANVGFSMDILPMPMGAVHP